MRQRAFSCLLLEEVKTLASSAGIRSVIIGLLRRIRSDIIHGDLNSIRAISTCATLIAAVLGSLFALSVEGVHAIRDWE